MKALLVVEKICRDDLIEDHIASLNLEVVKYSSGKSQVWIKEKVEMSS